MLNPAIIVVFYYPSENQIRRFVNLSKSYPVFIIDNSDQTLSIENSNNLFYYPLKENKGVATAQNLGIEKAKARGFNSFIFFDQDSDVNDILIKNLLLEYTKIKELDKNIGVLGPLIINKDSNKPYPFRFIEEFDSYVKTDLLISSGMVIEKETMEKVGGMMDQLFIDAVDHEWCWRAIKKGYNCYISKNILLEHKVGNNFKKFIGIPFIISNPQRYFYAFRNVFILSVLSHIPIKNKVKLFVRRGIDFISIPIFSKYKIETIKNMLQGIKAGIIFIKNYQK